MKKILGAIGALIITIVGGVAVYWFTTGVQHDRDRQEQQQEAQRQQDAEKRRQEDLNRQRQLEQQQAEEVRRKHEADELAKRPRMSEQELDINRNGSDYKDFVAADIDACLKACTQESQCRAITFTKSSRQCWMKSSVPARSNDNNYISAVKVGG